MIKILIKDFCKNNYRKKDIENIDQLIADDIKNDN